MKKRVSILIIGLFFIVGACSGSGEKTNLPMEMAAAKQVQRIELLIKQGKMKEALELAALNDEKYGHTKTFTDAKKRFLKSGIATKDPTTALSATRLIEMENKLLAFKAETGNWPEPGQIFKPLDAWHNEVYWVIGTPENSYDLLVVSAGKDGEPGSGDEIMIVWNAEDVGGYIDKKTGKAVGKRKKSKKAKDDGAKGKEDDKVAKVMTLAELNSAEKANGTPADKMLSADQLGAIGKKSKKSGQPHRDEMVLSLEEIKEAL